MKKYFNYCLRLVIVFFILFFSLQAEQSFWIPINGPFGSDINSIYVNKKTGVVYLATKKDGVYKSGINMQFWTSMNEGIMKPTTWVNDIIVNSQGKILAATDSLGVLRSVPIQGWSAVNNGMGGTLRFKCLYELKNGNVLAGSIGRALYRSTNFGDNWVNLNSGLANDENVNCIISTLNNNILIGTDNGIFQSTNNGQDWTSVLSSVGHVHSFAKTDDELTVMAGTDKGVYATIDDGKNWNAQSTGMGTDKDVEALTVNSDGVFFAGTKSNGIYKSTKSGFTWSEYNDGLDAKKIQSLAISNTNQIFAGSFFSFYISEDDNSGWKAHNLGLGIRTINSFASIEKRGEVIAGTDLGVYRTLDNGKTWEQLNSGFSKNVDINALLINRQGNIFAGTNGDGLYYSTNFGKIWQKINDPEINNATVINTLDTNSAGEIYAGTDGWGVYHSDDSTGLTWSQMSGSDNFNTKDVISFLVTKDDYLYAGTRANGLFKKTPSGSWMQETKISSSTNVSAIAFKDDQASGEIYVGTSSGMLRSIDNGNNWSLTSASPGGQVIAMIVGENGFIFVGTKGIKGVKVDSVSKNGDNWTTVLDTSGINNYEIKALEISGRGYIYGGAIKGGCYRSRFSTSAKVLQIAGNLTDTIITQQGKETIFTITITDLNELPVINADVQIKNDLDPSMDTVLTTNASGQITYSVTVPIDAIDGKYHFTFSASRIDYLDSDLLIKVLSVEKQKLHIEIDPKGLQIRDWLLPVDYTITVTDNYKIPLEGMTVYIEDGLTNNTENKASDAQGIINYSVTIPDQNPDSTYQILFFAKDNVGDNFPSDTIIAEIKVEHSDIQINGEATVCADNIYIYKTEKNADKSYVWKNISRGTFIGPTNLDSVVVNWDSAGNGSFDLEQTVISKSITTSRTLQVTIQANPVVTLNDYPNPVCPNDPFYLTGGTPNGGYYSGPGVDYDTFYGDSAGGQGIYTIYYTYEDPVTGCSATDSASIEVYDLPTVNLSLDSTVYCVSYLPFELTGGTPASGWYSGDGIDNDILDPAIAGVGPHSVTYTYTDPVTNCSNSAVQTIQIKPAPDVQLTLPKTVFCLSEIAFDLSGTANKSGKFSGDGVDTQNEIFNAQAAGLGDHKIIFTTDEQQDGCPGIDAVDITVIDVPTKPTITIAPDSVWIESSSTTDNQWYRDDKAIQGATNQKYFPDIGGKYQVTVTDGTTGCESFKSDPFFYNVKKSEAVLALPSFNTFQKPGSTFNIPIKFSDVGNIQTLGIDSISGSLTFNATVLYPVENTPKGSLNQATGMRTINLGIPIPNNLQNDQSIITLKFMATLGDSAGTDINYDSLITWRQGSVIPSNIIINPGRVEVDICRQGGDRLINFNGAVGLYLISPNPANEECEIEFSVTESGYSQLYIMNVNGQIVKTIESGKFISGKQKAKASLNDIAPGFYYIVLQTPTQKRVKYLEVIK